jgi:hypothetical protein
MDRMRNEAGELCSFSALSGVEDLDIADVGVKAILRILE